MHHVLTVTVSFRLELPQAMDGEVLKQGPLSAFLQWSHICRGSYIRSSGF